MARRFFARRYAQAVFELDRKRTSEWQSALDKVASLSQDATVAAHLENPKTRFEDKARLLHDRLGDVSPLVLNLVYLVLTRGRLSMLSDIAAEYQRLVDGSQGIERARVTTAVPLDDEDRLKLSQRLSEMMGRKVILESEYVNPNLIGGVVVRVAGKLLDGSTHSKLVALKEGIAGKV